MINTAEKDFVIREATSADYAAWDLFTEKHPNASPYHLIAWKRAIEDAYSHKCFYLIAEHNSKIVGILPLVKVSPPFMTGSICSLPFCDIGGALVTEQNALPLLLTRAKAISQTHTTCKLNLRGDVPLSDHDKKTDEGLTGQKVRMILALPESSESLMSSFKAKLRSQIKKAGKNGITYTQANNQSAIDAFYSIMQANMRLLGSPVHSKKWFESIIKHYGDNAKIGLVTKDGTVVGAAIVLLCANVATVPWASTLIEFNKYSPNMGLYWGLIGSAADNGFNTFDFGRSTVGEGTYRFKKQWGANPAPLNWQNYDHNGLIEPLETGASKLRPLIASTWSKLPASITNALGPLLRRYITL